MAFETLQSSKPTRKRNQTPRLHIYTVETRRPHLTDVRIRMTRPLMENLGWTDNQRVNVLVGMDEDEGKLILQPSPQGMFKFKKVKPNFTSSVLSSRAIPLPAGIKGYMAYEPQENGDLLITIS
jgi:hypothetical protein